MATNWPTSRDTFTNPSSGDTLDSPSHAAQHANINDAVEAMQLHAGLVLVKQQTIGSGVASVTVTDAFSAQFYNYRIMLSSGYTAATVDIQFTFVSQSGNFYGNRLSLLSSSTAITNVNTGASGLPYAEVAKFGTSRQGFATIDVYSPFVGRRKGITGNYYGVGYNGTYGYENNVTNSYTGFVLTPATGTLLGGELFVYGYNNG